MTAPTARRRVGPPPPVDTECGAALAALLPIPTVTVDRIPAMRADSGAVDRPALAELSRDGAYDVREQSVPGPAGGPDVGLLICRPTATATPVPALYYVHGGGMIVGTNRDDLANILDLAATAGAAVVSVDYRLAPETPHPGPVEDCYAGLTWLTDQAASLGVDPERIVLVGGSAGAGLAAATALLCRDRRGPAVAGQLLMSPMLDDRNDSPSIHQMADSPTWNRAANEVGWTALLGAARGGPEVCPAAAPARAEDLAGLPPTFIDVGSADPFRDEDVDFASRIWQAGGIAELHVWPGGFHAFEVVAPHAAITRAAVAARESWLRRLLPPLP
jgi:acetyl esterase/lipase